MSRGSATKLPAIDPETDLRLAGVRRMLLEWIAAAQDALRGKRVGDVDIHNARKLLKKCRAALRLLRGAIGEIAYRRENAALRDTARPLGTARDTRVLIGTLEDVIERFTSATSSLQLATFRRALRRDQMMARQAITPALINQQRQALRDIGVRIERVRMRGEDWSVIGGGLERIYRRGKKAMAIAARTRASEDLHDWRKQVKYLWHQLQILEPVCPGLMGKLAAQAHKLADVLGDEHDLAVLRGAIDRQADTLEVEHRDILIRMVERRRKRLQNKAFKLGEQLFSQRPRRFVSRIGRHRPAFRQE